jgi:pimeloyl-ACP methyl ester carboxylesterase
VTVRILTHVRTELALHELRAAAGDTPARPLLLLHGLGERTHDEVPVAARAWPGAVWGLDFTGHGASTVPRGGGYTAEALMADVDHALAVLADPLPVTLLGRGLGAYVALLIAGARPELVGGVVLTDGPGLSGGGPSPHSSSIVRTRTSGASDLTTAPDPYALLELARDIRPADYATAYARQAVEFSEIDRPISVAAVARPPWLAAVADLPGVVTERVGDALARFSA